MKLFALTLSTLIAVTSRVNGQCSTPSGVQGECMVISKCPSLSVLVNKPDRTPADTELLRKSACGFEGLMPKVCCPNPCFTPDNKQGQCINLYSCPHMANMLKPPVSNNNRIFVQKSRCTSNDPLSVCCGPATQTNPKPKNTCATTLTALPPDPKTKCCGYDNIGTDRIVGGNYTTIDQYPWLTLIEYQSRDMIKLLCGGVLISSKYVLTAAHCVTGPVLDSGRPVNVRLGEYIIDTDPDCDYAPGSTEPVDCAPPIVVIPIEKIIPHPQYEKPTRKWNDIALIRMRDNAPFTDFIRPICLPSTPDITLTPPDNFKLFAAGWGAINGTHRKSNIKLHVDLPFVNMKNCQPQYTKRKTQLWQGQLCAGGEAGKDSCRGDSGGPLMYETESGPFEVIGLVSFGPTPCGMENVPGVYTHVVEYLDWIRSNITP